MIVFLLALYIGLLALFVWLKLLPFNNFWKFSPIIVLIILNVGLFIPMGWGAPQGRAVVVRNSVAITPDVSGEVVDVPVTANTPLKAGDVLFRIDATPFEAQVRALEAQRGLARQRLEEAMQLQRNGAGRQNDVELRTAEVDQFKAQLDAAKWNLDKTTVRAPTDGYVTNLALRKGARVGGSPAMAFIDTADTIIGVEIPQIYARYVEPGQPIELTFKFAPGTVYSGKVETVVQAVATGQAQTSGAAIAPTQIQSAPFVVRVTLDDKALARRLPAGATGDAAIYTEHIRVAHVIRKVILRQIAIANYINPF